MPEKSVLYVNSDTNGRGFLSAGGNHDLQHFVNLVADDLTDPETPVSVGKRLRAKLEVDSLARSANEEAKANAEISLDPTKDFTIQALGSLTPPDSARSPA